MRGRRKGGARLKHADRETRGRGRGYIAIIADPNLLGSVRGDIKEILYLSPSSRAAPSCVVREAEAGRSKVLAEGRHQNVATENSEAQKRATDARRRRCPAVSIRCV